MKAAWSLSRFDGQTERDGNLLNLYVGEWRIGAENGALPDLVNFYSRKASHVFEYDMLSADGKPLFVGIGRADAPGWPELVACQRYEDGSDSFSPGILLVPETSTLFIGAGQRLLGYDLRTFENLWEEQTMVGFWGWHQQGDHVFLLAELEFGVFTSAGKRLWSTFVEPPWDFRVDGDIVELDIMDKIQRHRISDGTTV